MVFPENNVSDFIVKHLYVGTHSDKLGSVTIIPEKAYHEAFDTWKFRWKRCIDAGGTYFGTF